MVGYVYILQSLTNFRYYVGSTTNLTQRLIDHNSGKAAYTRLTKPFKLVFKKEYPSIIEAKQIEFKLKKLKSRKIIERIIEEKIIKLK